MDTRLTSRNRRVRLRKDSVISATSKSRGHMSSSADSSDSLSPSQSHSSETVSVPQQKKDVYYLSQVPFPKPQGRLIVVPPEVSNFIRAYNNNPDYIRACLGDYYWKALCIPSNVTPLDEKDVFS